MSIADQQKSGPCPSAPPAHEPQRRAVRPACRAQRIGSRNRGRRDALPYVDAGLIILGAGCSVECGYPPGTGFAAEFEKFLGEIQEIPEENYERAKVLEKESAELQNEAERLAGEIEEMAGESPVRIG